MQDLIDRKALIDDVAAGRAQFKSGYPKRHFTVNDAIVCIEQAPTINTETPPGGNIKPCPFCGGRAVIGYAIYDYNRWGVYCKNCGASVEVSDFAGEPDTEEQAIKNWNRRVREAE